MARYPSGPRERSAKPPFVGSNPTRASTHRLFPDRLSVEVDAEGVGVFFRGLRRKVDVQAVGALGEMELGG
jgi:hypothetical protein